MDWITLVFWSLDCVMSLITGVTVRGVIVMRFSRILIVYLKGWFILDLLVIGPDWLFTIAALVTNTRDSGGGNVGRLVRIFRVLRVARLLRLAKLQRLASKIKDRIESELTFILVSIAKLMTLLVTVNHFIAAVWYSMGLLSEELEMRSWLSYLGNKANDENVGELYTLSFHWSICMFTPGGMAVQPQNFVERTFAIIVLIFGMVVFSAFVSSLTAAIGQLKALQGDRSRDLWVLRKYLNQRGLDRRLAYRTLWYAEHVCSKGPNLLAESQVALLASLTVQLRSEVKFHAVFSCVHTHPLLWHITQTSNAMLAKFVATVLSERLLATNDWLFNNDAAESHMYIVKEPPRFAMFDLFVFLFLKNKSKTILMLLWSFSQLIAFSVSAVASR